MSQHSTTTQPAQTRKECLETRLRALQHQNFLLKIEFRNKRRELRTLRENQAPPEQTTDAQPSQHQIRLNVSKRQLKNQIWKLETANRYLRQKISTVDFQKAKYVVAVGQSQDDTHAEDLTRVADGESGGLFSGLKKMAASCVRWMRNKVCGLCCGIRKFFRR